MQTTLTHTNQRYEGSSRLAATEAIIRQRVCVGAGGGDSVVGQLTHIFIFKIRQTTNQHISMLNECIIKVLKYPFPTSQKPTNIWLSELERKSIISRFLSTLISIRKGKLGHDV